MSSVVMASRQHGVCQGPLYRTIVAKPGSKPVTSSYFSSSSSKNKTVVLEYCVLVGVRFVCYETQQGLETGLHPTGSFSIVGASALSSEADSFRLVTNQGTHLKCSAPTHSCRDTWLQALNAGLERSLTSVVDDPLMKCVKPRYHSKDAPTKYCQSCGKLERHEFPLHSACAPLSQYGMEERQDLCPKCDVAQGMVEHTQFLIELFSSQQQERRALLGARQVVLKKLAPKLKIANDAQTHLRLTPLSHHLLQQALKSPACLAHGRVSPTLESLSLKFENGIVGVLEFIELLEYAVGIKDVELSKLKQQAFRVAGDMGTALKLLNENALPNQNETSSTTNPPHQSQNQKQQQSPHDQSTELLQCILEFFLDLLQAGELQTLAFYWPQLCNIHLQMLPPTNFASLQRIELVEDFLFTVATQHSIQLAIALIWSHTADLEDSRTLPSCAKRKFAVLRFLCELESLLFDFDSGWGGGSVTVGVFLSPSNHQITILKNAVKEIQTHRLAQTERLSISHRLNKLSTSSESRAELPPEVLAQEALRVAKNADYLSSHLAFTKRLCDIAEKLRFLPVEDRAKTLQFELNKLNASGTMGGDPLNKVSSEHSRVVRIPSKEGHVFRSKERTPVLLLVELNDEGAENKKQRNSLTPYPTAPKNNIKDQEEKKSPETEEEVQNELKKLEEEPEDPATLTESENKEEGDPAEGENVVTSEDKSSEMDAEDEEESSPPKKQEEAPAEPENKEQGDPAEKENIGTSEGESSETDAKEEELNEEKDRPETDTKEEGNRGQESGSGEPDADESGEASDERVKQQTDVGAGAGDSQNSKADNDGKGGTLVSEGSETGAVDGDESEVSLTTPKHDYEMAFKSESNDAVALCGSEDGLGEASDNTSFHALRRFDSPEGQAKVITPSASKETVEALLTNVVAKQLQLPSLMSSEEEITTEGRKPEKEDIEGRRNEEAKRTPEPIIAPKMSTLGVGSGGDSVDGNALSKTGDTRREVLNSIMMKGMSDIHSIAAGTATAMQRHLQALERRRCVELLLRGEDKNGGDKTAQEELIRSVSHDDLEAESASELQLEEDEAMESIRLLLIQYQVAQGALSLNDAAAVLAPHQSLKEMNTKRRHRHSEGTIMRFGREFPEVDAGDIDARLTGCGVLPPAVLQALTLWKANMITNGELLELVKKDLEYAKSSVSMKANSEKLNENSAFWGRFAFGERWAEKRSRIAASSADAAQPGWDLIGVIVKSNDDLRQEAFVMQLIELCREAFQEAGLELWLLPYRILSTGRTTGIIEMVRNAMSFDALKKRPGYGRGGLREHLTRMTQFAADPGEAFKSAQQNFVQSLAAYSLLSYLFMFKDRHNGNILLDTAGHVIHIDFGFVFGVAPGGSFSLELTTPFKLTEEMIEVMNGLRSSLFSEFITLFCCGFLALQAHCETFVTLVEITCKGSTFSCFEGKDGSEVVDRLRERFKMDLDKEQTIAFCLDLIKEATQSYGTAQYDYFQYLSQGIAT